MRYCLTNVPHTYVYRKLLWLSAGTQYIFETRNLREPIYYTCDTYMYLVRGNTIVAKNDDYNGLASLIAYVPTVSGNYLLVIRAYSKYTGGKCDVYQSTAGSGPVPIDSNVKFGGYPVSAHWKADERLLTRNATGDTYLYLVHGNTMLRDDDSGDGVCSSIRPGYSGSGIIIVGSYGYWTEGTTYLCNYYKSYLDNPGSEDEIDDPNIIISENMAKFQIELMQTKRSLEQLSHEEKEAEIRKFRDKILTKEEIDQLAAPRITIPKKYVAASGRYDKLLEANEDRLKRLSHAKRDIEMAKLEKEKKQIFKNLVPQEDG